MNKLIRDKVPADIARRGAIARTAQVGDAHVLASMLREKLVEEAHEVYLATDRVNLIDEMADVMEVLQALAARSGIGWADVIDAKVRKRMEFGAFDDGTFLIEVIEPLEVKS